jgi:phosphoribosylamine--glycine ligase
MSETVLLVGGGGREHAIARSLAPDCELHACASNRNPGIVRLADGFETLDETDPDAVVDYAEYAGASLAVIGPEAPLAAGVADALNAVGVYAFGPEQSAARIETDKAYQREFMAQYDISGCPDFETFDDREAAAEYVETVEGDVALKPRGLTGGKGVRVMGDQVTRAEAKRYIRDSDWDDWVIEERLVGEEFTLQALVANGELRTTHAVQDHKRAYEGDEGPNTGGMGSYSAGDDELPFMEPADYADAVGILRETVEALDGYTGVLYGQFMLTAEGPRVVEYNARFGDPEAMNTLPVMETPLIDVLTAARDGDSLPELDFASQATVCKYAVPEGYPDDPVAGARVDLSDAPDDALLYTASVEERDDGVYTTTSRSFAAVGTGDTIGAAERKAEQALKTVGTDGLRVRHDIGTDALVQRRIDHMNELRNR